ncbi:EF-P 5-aminopentanol modification-associated protein YfmF [Lacticaseibacillus daqingensis]|uniref:EF-P 5-aminopentanol modification-associated protein YfmF n=1 Tax=Lacticaseibacillus daqingensis TaxID=2486014 RepID=UPI000F7B67FF|nr:pitrilysin family protein [Lacticaseibacillus daqingensis]
MRIELTSGVYLNVIPTTKFKTTRIAVHFLAPTDAMTYAARTLLTSVLETSSAAYPTQAALAAELELMYGANFGIGVSKDGQVHRVTATLDLVADALAGQPLLARGCRFLAEVLLHPKRVGDHFDPAVVTRERHNLMDYLSSLAEDRQLQASLAAQALYFAADADQATPSFGTAEAVAAVTETDLQAAYQQLLTLDQIELVVLGDVQPAAVTELVAQMGFAPRNPHPLSLITDQPVAATVRTQTQVASVNQAKMNLAYHTPIDLYGPNYYPALVAAELFGGSPLSFLFTNVREKASLAYYASSVLDPFRHLMMVQTGIDGTNAAVVQDLIAAQLKKVATGDFSDALLQKIKDGLKNGRQIAYDSPRFLARQGLLHALIPAHRMAYADYAAQVDAVTRAQVQAAAEAMTLQAIYLLTDQEAI